MEELKNAEEQSFGESPSVTTGSPSIAERKVGSNQDKTIEYVESLEHIKALNEHKGVVDITAPIDSVKSAVSKFGGIVDWKAHKVMAVEKHAVIRHELENVQEAIPKYKKQSESAQIATDEVQEELDCTRKLVEELKDALEKTVTEEAQAKQDSELAQLRVKEMEQGISDDASMAAKTQLEVAKTRHESAIEELKAVKEELAALQEDYHRLVSERNFAISRSEEVVSLAKDAEKKAEDLTVELIAIKEALESAHASHLEAEERRIGIAMEREQDSISYEEELKQAQDEFQQLSDQKLSTEELRSKLETASTMLLNLKTELAFYLEGETKSELASTKKELEEVNASVEIAKDEVNFLKEAASSLKAELDREIETVTTLRQREGMSSVTISSLEAELTRMQSELDLVLTKEREAREKVEELPKLLDQATHDTDQAKSVAHLASEELQRAKEEAEQIEVGTSTMKTRLAAILKEIEATKRSQALAIAAVKAMLETEPPDSNNGVTLELEEYYNLSKDAHEAEESANEKVISVIEKIKEAKNSERINLQKLGEAHKELEEKKEAFKMAVLMAEKANDGKLSAEQELRGKRAENELKRRVSDAAASHLEMNHSEDYGEENRCLNGEASLRFNTMSCPDLYADQTAPELTPSRKKSFFPRIVMFLARKKVQSLK